jgi:hypothetical protein
VSRLALIVIVLLFARPIAGRAQELAVTALRPIPSPVFSARPAGPLGRPTPADSADTLRKRIPSTKWKQGALIGGVTGGLCLGLLARGLCRGSDAIQSCLLPTLGVAALGVVMGGTVGALVGGQFPERKARD